MGDAPVSPSDTAVEADGVDMDLDSLLDDVPTELENVEDEKIDSKTNPVIFANADPSFMIEVEAEPIADIEYAMETDAYVRAKLQLEADMKALKQEQKDLQDEFKDEGVDIKAANKAISEIKKEIKETPDEAKLVNDLKTRYHKDERIFATISALID